MPTVVHVLLQCLVRLGGAATRYQLQADSGYDDLAYLMPRLLDGGWVVAPYRGLWQITERGKIVCAIETGRRTKAVARGKIHWYVAMLDRCDDWKAHARA
jgi:hypothetical protein